MYYPGGTKVIPRILISEKQEGESHRESGTCASAGSEVGRRGRQPSNAGGLETLEQARKQIVR